MPLSILLVPSPSRSLIALIADCSLTARPGLASLVSSQLRRPTRLRLGCGSEKREGERRKKASVCQIANLLRSVLSNEVPMFNSKFSVTLLRSRLRLHSVRSLAFQVRALVFGSLRKECVTMKADKDRDASAKGQRPPISRILERCLKGDVRCSELSLVACLMQPRSALK